MLKFISSTLTSILGSFGAGIISKLATKKAVGFASTLAFIALTVAFIVCIKESLNFLASDLPTHLPPLVKNQLGQILPTNFVQVMSAIISSMICRAGYDIGREKIQLLNSAN